ELECDRLWRAGMMNRNTRSEAVPIALVGSDRSVSIMYFVTRQAPHKNHPGWEREATDAAISEEIQRAGYEATEWHRVGPDAIPSDRTHRNAWVWDGQRIVIDESRIKPKAAPVDAPPAGAVQAYDPRLDAIAQQLSERFQGVVEELWREFNARQEETLQEAERRFRLGLEAIAVVGRVQSNEPVDLDAVPALVNEVKASGVPVTEEAVIAAADRHAARIHQIAAGRA